MQDIGDLTLNGESIQPNDPNDSESSGDTLDGVLDEMADFENQTAAGVDGSPSPGVGVSGPVCGGMGNPHCQCLHCFYMLNPSDPSVDGPVTLTPNGPHGDYSGPSDRNTRHRWGGSPPPPPALYKVFSGPLTRMRIRSPLGTCTTDPCL